MPQGKAVFLGLNQVGATFFVVLLILFMPLCWLPLLIDSMKADPEATE